MTHEDYPPSQPQGVLLPGWYPDPQSPPWSGRQRYWDGSQWTPHTFGGSQTPPKRSGPRWALILGASAGGVLLAVLMVIVLLRAAAPQDVLPDTGNPGVSPTTGSASASPTPSASATPSLPTPSESIGKPLRAALAKYVRAYKAVWKPEGIDYESNLGPQLQVRAEELRDRYGEVVERSADDVAASDPSSNFGALLKALDLQVTAVEDFARELTACGTATRVAALECEIDVWEDQADINQAQRRVRTAFELVNLPELAADPSERVKFNVAVGECFNVGTPFRVVDCNSPHDGEVFASYVIPMSSSEPYPGEEQVTKIAQRQCKQAFEGYVGVRQRFSELSIAFVYPSPESWSIGERKISCVVQLDQGKLTESVRGRGR